MPDKPKYDPQKHHRRSIRLKGYDYSQAGAYFVTICVKDNECMFGKIGDSEMYLNEAGLMIDKWWQKIPEKFPDIELGEYQIMPNHFHAVVINVGADPRVCPEPLTRTNKLAANNEKSDVEMEVEQLMFDPNVERDEQVDSVEQLIFGSSAAGGEHVGSPLHVVVQWFKTMSTNDYIRNVKQNSWPPFNKKMWQRNYFEHIIRNEKSYGAIANYIYNNPINWGKDKFFVG